MKLAPILMFAGTACGLFAGKARSVEVSGYGIDVRAETDAPAVSSASVVSSASRTTTGTQRVDVYRHYDARPCTAASASPAASGERP